MVEFYSQENYLKMPIKDITNEEKSMLYMVGRKPVEINKITEYERGWWFSGQPLMGKV